MEGGLSGQTIKRDQANPDTSKARCQCLLRVSLAPVRPVAAAQARRRAGARPAGLDNSCSLERSNRPHNAAWAAVPAEEAGPHRRRPAEAVEPSSHRRWRQRAARWGNRNSRRNMGGRRDTRSKAGNIRRNRNGRIHRASRHIPSDNSVGHLRRLEGRPARWPGQELGEGISGEAKCTCLSALQRADAGLQGLSRAEPARFILTNKRANNRGIPSICQVDRAGLLGWQAR